VYIRCQMYRVAWKPHKCETGLSSWICKLRCQSVDHYRKEVQRPRTPRFHGVPARPCHVALTLHARGSDADVRLRCLDALECAAYGQNIASRFILYSRHRWRRSFDTSKGRGGRFPDAAVRSPVNSDRHRHTGTGTQARAGTGCCCHARNCLISESSSIHTLTLLQRTRSPAGLAALSASQDTTALLDQHMARSRHSHLLANHLHDQRQQQQATRNQDVCRHGARHMCTARPQYARRQLPQ